MSYGGIKMADETFVLTPDQQATLRSSVAHYLKIPYEMFSPALMDVIVMNVGHFLSATTYEDAVYWYLITKGNLQMLTKLGLFERMYVEALHALTINSEKRFPGRG